MRSRPSSHLNCLCLRTALAGTRKTHPSAFLRLCRAPLPCTAMAGQPRLLPSSTHAGGLVSNAGAARAALALSRRPAAPASTDYASYVSRVGAAVASRRINTCVSASSASNSAATTAGMPSVAAVGRSHPAPFTAQRMRRHRRRGGRVQASGQSACEEETDVIIVGAGLAGLAAAAALQKAGESVLHYLLHCIMSGWLFPCTEPL